MLGCSVGKNTRTIGPFAGGLPGSGDVELARVDGPLTRPDEGVSGM